MCPYPQLCMNIPFPNCPHWSDRKEKLSQYMRHLVTYMLGTERSTVLLISQHEFLWPTEKLGAILKN